MTENDSNPKDSLHNMQHNMQYGRAIIEFSAALNDLIMKVREQSMLSNSEDARMHIHESYVKVLQLFNVQLTANQLLHGR